MKAQARLNISFLAGDDIKESFDEAIRLAKQLNITVEFDFNGISCIAYPHGSSYKGVYEYNLATDSNSKLAFS